MDKKLLIPLGLVVGAVVLAVFLLMGPGPDPLDTPQPASQSEDLLAMSGQNYNSLDGEVNFDSSPRGVQPAAATGSSGSKVASFLNAAPATPAEVILERIDDAIVTYSPEGVGMIAPYLSSGDVEIREAAVEALMQLGEPSGAELLRKAARSAANARERNQLLEAAAFIDLPPVELEIVNP